MKVLTIANFILWSLLGIWNIKKWNNRPSMQNKTHYIITWILVVVQLFCDVLVAFIK